MSFVGLTGDGASLQNVTNAILIEAFRRSGYPAPTADQLLRARVEWLEELWRDAADEKRWRTLEQTVVLIPSAYVHDYPLPSPLVRPLRLRFYDGDVKGTASDGGAQTITLAADITPDQLGRKLFLTGGTGAGQVNRIVSAAGAVCTMEKVWATNPDSTTTYMLANLELPIHGPAPYMPHLGMGPSSLITHWDVFDTTLQLYPLLNASTYAVEIDGIVDVSLFDQDEDEERLVRIMREWRPAFVYGLMAKIFESDDDDTRAERYDQKYESAKLKLMKADARKRRSLAPVSMRSIGGMPRGR